MNFAKPVIYPPKLPSPALRARLMATIASDPSPTRRAWRWRACAATAAGAFVTTALFVAMGGVVRGARSLPLVAAAAAPGLFTAALMAWAARPTRSMLGRPRPAIVLACATALVFLALGAAATSHAGAHDEPALKIGTHVGCGLISMVQAAAPFGLLFFLSRRAVPVLPTATGAALGMTAGAAAEMMAYLRCPYTSLGHGLTAHVLPVAVSALVGAALGRRVLAPR